MNEEQIETYVKLKTEKEPEVYEQEFIRNDRNRRKTIAIESIQVSDAIPEFRRIKTIQRQDEGVIEEINSSEEDSKPEEVLLESEDSNDYNELQNIVNEEKKNNVLARISTMRLAASRKNTIERIMMKERRNTTPGEFNDYAQLLVQDDVNNNKISEQYDENKKLIESKNESNNCMIEDNNLKAEKEHKLSLKNNLKEEDKQLNNLSNLASDKLNNLEDMEANLISDKLVDKEFKEQNDIINSMGKDLESLRKMDAKKTEKYNKRQEAEEMSEFSSIASEQNDNESMSVNSLMNLDIEKKTNEKFNFENFESISVPSQISSINPVLTHPIKSSVKFEESPSSSISCEAKENLNAVQQDKKKEEKINHQEEKKKDQEAIILEKLKGEENLLIKNIEKISGTPKIKSENYTGLPSIKKSDSPSNFYYSSKPIDPSFDLNNMKPRKVSIKNLKLMTEATVTDDKDTSMDKSLHDESGRKNSSKKKLSNNNILTKTSQPASIMEAFDTKRKYFKNIFDAPSPKASDKNGECQTNVENAEVFGGNIQIMPRSHDLLYMMSPRTMMKQKLEPIEEKSSLKINAESLPNLNRSRNVKSMNHPISPSSNAIMTQETHFLYYLELIGHPNTNKSSLNFFNVQKNITPANVISMSKRLNIRVSSRAYSSFESDFA